MKKMLLQAAAVAGKEALRIAIVEVAKSLAAMLGNDDDDNDNNIV